MANKTALQRWESYTALVNTEQGKAFYNDYLDLLGVFKPTFDSDPLKMAYNEGKRAAGLMLMQIVNHNPEVLSKIMQQQLETERFNLLQQENSIYG